MKRLAWFVLVLFGIFPVYSQPRDPNFQKLVQLSRPDFGGVYTPGAVQVLNGTFAALSANASPAPTIPPTLPQEFAKLGPSAWLEDDVYVVPVTRPADLDLEVYVDGVLAARQDGAVSEGNYKGEEEDLTGSFRISGPGSHTVQIVGITPQGLRMIQSGTYELPVHPKPQVSPLTIESGDHFTILPKVALTGAPLDDINVRESFVLMGNYSFVQENWDPDNQDPEQGGRNEVGRRMASKVRVEMRNGELHADYPARPGRNGYVVYKFFVKYSGGWATHEAVLAHTKPYTPEPKLGINNGFEFYVRDDWSTVITSTINTNQALGGWYYWEVMGRRRGPLCVFGNNDWFSYGWGYIPPGQDSYVIAMSTYLPKNFDFTVRLSITLEVSRNRWEYFPRVERTPGMNQEMGCWNEKG